MGFKVIVAVAGGKAQNIEVRIVRFYLDLDLSLGMPCVIAVVDSYVACGFHVSRIIHKS